MQIDAAQNGDAGDGLNLEQIAFPPDIEMPTICALIDEETVRIEVLSQSAKCRPPPPRAPVRPYLRAVRQDLRALPRSQVGQGCIVSWRR